MIEDKRAVVSAGARELDEAFLALVDDWRYGGAGCDDAAFDAHARALFLHQIARNEAYARFAANLGYTRSRPPQTWRDIPAVPARAFKDATLATFDPALAELEFHTSGTTAAQAGKHYVERARIYDASLLAAFDRFMLADRAALRYFFLVNPSRSSSLAHMLEVVARERGGASGGPFFVRGDAIQTDALLEELRRATQEGAPVFLGGTAFAFAALLHELAAAHDRAPALPAGSRLMETGGFKGRTKAVARESLYARLADAFGVPAECIVAEYGMTELLSQYYDAVESRASATRVKRAPPWLRTLVVDAEGREVAGGETGWLRHFDLANRSSVVAIETEDRGYAAGGGIVLLGRDEGAPLRGCSLGAEELHARS